MGMPRKYFTKEEAIKANNARSKAWHCSNWDRSRNNNKKYADTQLLKWQEVIKSRGMNYCKICGYSRSAICFHHKDPRLKTTRLSQVMRVTITDERIKELAGCTSLCLNCHFEFHKKYGCKNFPYLSDEMIENWKQFGL